MAEFREFDVFLDEDHVVHAYETVSGVGMVSQVIRKRRDPATVLPHGIPADVVDVEMRADDGVH